MLGTLLVSRRSDRTGDRKKHLAFVYGVSAIAIALSAYVPSHVIAYLLLCVAGLIYAGNPLFWSLASSFRAGAAGAATIALINTVAQFGGLVGPWSIGLIRGSTCASSARGIDVTIFSPRAASMGHHLAPAEGNGQWSRICNDLIHRVCQLFPRDFAGVCQLPQAPGAAPADCVPELRRCVEELGFVGCNLNPDPSGGNWSGVPMTDRAWYPLYEVMTELDVPAMIHVSSSCNPNFHATGAHYLNGDTAVFMQLVTGDLFRDFPTLRFIIPHGGGAVPYHWGRYRGLAQGMDRPPLRDHLLKNVFFDTCVYHQDGVELLTKVIPAQNILFASEALGAVAGIDPETGYHYDDTRRYVDSIPWLGENDRKRIFEENAYSVYGRLATQLKRQRG